MKLTGQFPKFSRPHDKKSLFIQKKIADIGFAVIEFKGIKKKYSFAQNSCFMNPALHLLTMQQPNIDCIFIQQFFRK